MTDKETTSPQKSEPQYTSNQENGFNFTECLEVLIRKKNLVFLTLIFSILMTSSYVFLTPQVYVARVGFLPPKTTVLPKAFPEGILKETRESLYKVFLERLLSFNHQEAVFKKGNFFEKFKSPKVNETPQSMILDLNSKIKVKQDIMAIDKLFSKPVYLEMVGSQPEAMAEFLDSIYQTAIINIRTEILTPAIERLEKDLKNQIDHLNNQLALTKKFNVIENNFQHARAGAGQPKWFLLGEKVLEEELRSEKLKADELSRAIKSVTSDSSSQFKIHVVTVTQPSIPPTTPIKPRKFLIISIGVFMGLFLGIIFAFISDAADNLRRKKESSALR